MDLEYVCYVFLIFKLKKLHVILSDLIFCLVYLVKLTHPAVLQTHFRTEWTYSKCLVKGNHKNIILQLMVSKQLPLFSLLIVSGSSLSSLCGKGKAQNKLLGSSIHREPTSQSAFETEEHRIEKRMTCLLACSVHKFSIIKF